MATLDTEIRKLQPSNLYTLTQILDQSDSWKKLMAIIPKDGNESQYMFNNDHVIMIEQAVRQLRRSGAEIFLSEWSTMGRKRPTCQFMLHLLIKAQLFRAADYLAVNILKGDPPERPKFGPAATVDVSDKILEELLKLQANVQVESDLPPEPKMSWSLHFEEKPVEVIAEQTKKTVAIRAESDFMKFSKDISDLIKFDMSSKEMSENLSEQVSDLMKFSNKTSTEKIELKKHILEEARSEDIPLFVRENNFQSSKIITSKIGSLDSSIDSINTSEMATIDQQIDLPNISQPIIPIVVMEYNEKEKT